MSVLDRDRGKRGIVIYKGWKAYPYKIWSSINVLPYLRITKRLDNYSIEIGWLIWNVSIYRKIEMYTLDEILAEIEREKRLKNR